MSTSVILRLTAVIAIAIGGQGCFEDKGVDLSGMEERLITPSDLPPGYCDLLKKDIWYDDFFTTYDKVDIWHKTFQSHSWVDREQFIIDGQKFFMPRNGARENPPYVLADKHLYYRIMYYQTSDTAYAVIDLSAHLTY